MSIYDNIFAYTAPGSSLPGYVSINRLPNGDVSVSVRGEPDNGPGNLAEFTIPAAEWKLEIEGHDE